MSLHLLINPRPKKFIMMEKIAPSHICLTATVTIHATEFTRYSPILFRLVP